MHVHGQGKLIDRVFEPNRILTRDDTDLIDYRDGLFLPCRNS